MLTIYTIITPFFIYCYRKANQKILELESELRDQNEENSNKWMLKINELQNQLQCEKDTRSLDLEVKNTTISDKGYYLIIIPLINFNVLLNFPPICIEVGQQTLFLKVIRNKIIQIIIETLVLHNFIESMHLCKMCFSLFEKFL